MPTETAPKDTGWTLRDLKDTRETIVEAIQASARVPEHAKTFLIAEVNQLPASAKLVRVDAHCHIVGAKRILTTDIQPL